MEFFLPSLIILLVSLLIFYFIMPSFSVHVLAILSVALFIFGIYHHMKIFSYEYHYSTWQEQLKAYGSQIMMGLMGLVIVFYLFFFMGDLKNTGPIMNTNTANKSPIANIMNNVTNAANKVLNMGQANNTNKNQSIVNKINNSIVNTFSNVKSLINGNQKE